MPSTLPVAGSNSRKVGSIASTSLKSPFRIRAVGTVVAVEPAVALVVAFVRREVEQLVFLDRPADGAAADRDARIELRGVEELPRVQLVLIAEVERRAPSTSFVPDLVTSVIAAPPAMPWPASKLFVLMLTVSIVSAGAT